MSKIGEKDPNTTISDDNNLIYHFQREIEEEEDLKENPETIQKIVN